MDDIEYKVTQNNLMLLAQFAEDLQLEEFIDKITTCEAIEPLINPTLYMLGADKLQAVKKIAISAKHFQGVVREHIGIFR